jgi:peptidoglycan/xylan/chitin deacetylase (PgdA/CDA1 family)
MAGGFLHSAYQNLQKRHPGVLFYNSDASRRVIALTFDDGPHPRDTPQVLDVLAKHDVRATFFLIGQDVEKYPHLVKQIYQCGHQLALHCYRHVPFPMQSASTLKGQLKRSRTAIANACGISPETIHDVRPPYGLFTARTLAYLNEWGYRLIMWSCIPQHWMQPIAWSIWQVIDETIPGGIIVLHDGHGHGRKVATILDTIVPGLKDKGYSFITVSNMETGRHDR